MDNKKDGAVFCRIEMIKFKIVKLQYKRYLKKTFARKVRNILVKFSF